MVCTIGTKPQRRLGDVPKGVTVNTTIEGPDGISLHVVHTDEPNDRFEEWCSVLSKEQGSLPPSAGNTAAPSRIGELLARALSASFLCRLGIPPDVLALKFVLQFWKAFKRQFPSIGATRSMHLRWQLQPPFVPVHTLSASACMP